MPGKDTYVVLLLHCDGADTSTTFTDHSKSNFTVTATGNAQVDTAQSKFGGASALFDGNGDYLSIPDSTAWDFGTSDFTIDLQVRFSNVSADQAIIDVQNGANGSGGILVYLETSIPGIRVTVRSTQYNFAWSASINTWYHIEVNRSGTNLRVFIDGSQIGSTETNSTDLSGSSATVTVGRNQSDSADDLEGWVDEVRISKGIARHTAAFTAPTGPYSVSAAAIAFFDEFKPG